MENATTTNAAKTNDCFLTDAEINDSYNLTLHIVSIFVLLVVSFTGALISVGSVRVKYLHINPIIINIGKFFGSGVVLATGFIHILPDAMETLSDPCLPESWTVYGAYGGLFAMLAVLGMQFIEFLAHQRIRARKYAHIYSTSNNEIKQIDIKENHDSKVIESNQKKQMTNNSIESPSLESMSHMHEKFKMNRQENEKIEAHESIKHIRDQIKQSQNVKETIETVNKSNKVTEIDDQYDESKNVNHFNNHIDVEGKENHAGTVVIDITNNESIPSSTDVCDMSTHCHGTFLQDDDNHNKISTYLLEFGIALHSVLIGLTLGTATDSFVALFIALSFHQFFEAIALGAQIARTEKISIKSAMFMVIFFSLTTPVGIAIGIGIHSGTYNPKSVASLLVTGILDSLSAGILIYVALVNLITADMGAHANRFHSLSKRLQFLYFAALYLGVATMAVIGRWA